MNTNIFLLALLTLIPFGLQAQEGNDSIDNRNQKIIYKVIPQKNFSIKDKIIIENKSPFYIIQIVVALSAQNGEYQPLGSATYIAPNEVYELAAFKDNSLKKLKGQQIAIKAKGVKLLVGETNQTSVWTPNGSVGVKHKELNNDLINSLKSSDITYDFDAKLYESRHDLYIELYSAGGKGVMDF